GDGIRLAVEVGRDAHLRVYNVKADGVVQLFSNAAEPDDRAKAGRPAEILGEGTSLVMTRPPEARDAVEYLHVLASTPPFRPVDVPQTGSFSASTVYTLLEAQERAGAALRDLEFVPAEGPAPAADGPPLVAEAVIPVRWVQPVRDLAPDAGP